jgi:hypothetical protein
MQDARVLSALCSTEMVPGIFWPTGYIGEKYSFFTNHVEDSNEGGMNICLEGFKVWYITYEEDFDLVVK